MINKRCSFSLDDLIHSNYNNNKKPFNSIHIEIYTILQTMLITITTHTHSFKLLITGTSSISCTLDYGNVRPHCIGNLLFLLFDNL